MIAPFFLLLGSILLTIAAIAVPGLEDLVLLGAPSVIASLVLIIGQIWNRLSLKSWVIVDGSNVMYWKGEGPAILTVREVVDHLRDNGYSPGVIFDANAGYLLTGRYQHDRSLSSQLNLAVDRVMVVPKGTPADPYILKIARDFGAQVISNDRFRDWAEAHPEVAEPGRVVKGGYRKGQLWLDLGEEECPSPNDAQTFR